MAQVISLRPEEYMKRVIKSRCPGNGAWHFNLWFSAKGGVLLIMLGVAVLAWMFAYAYAFASPLLTAVISVAVVLILGALASPFINNLSIPPGRWMDYTVPQFVEAYGPQLPKEIIDRIQDIRSKEPSPEFILEVLDAPGRPHGIILTQTFGAWSDNISFWLNRRHRLLAFDHRFHSVQIDTSV